MNKKVKNLLIIYPYWPPSNLAGVHRSRLISNYLPKYGWEPTILTVDESYYEEKLDRDIEKTVNQDTRVIKVAARAVKNKKRYIGDIGIRSYKFLKAKAIDLLENENFDFIWLPVPPYYTSLLGPFLNKKFGVPYGVDYIDPWIRPSDVLGKTFSKAWLTNQVAKILEPKAVSRASLISGVAELYYRPVLERNFKNKEVIDVAMPYGFDPNDHKVNLHLKEFPWDKDEKPILYAGAFLPKSKLPLKALFKAVKMLVENGKWDTRRKFYFLGTGQYKGTSISEFSKQYGIEDYVIEIRDRFPFLHILNFLSSANAVLILGSTESHYTASKTFQSILSQRPIISFMHQESTAVQILEETKTDELLVKYKEGDNEMSISEEFIKVLSKFLEVRKWDVNLAAIDKYSASNSAKVFVNGIEKALLIENSI